MWTRDWALKAIRFTSGSGDKQCCRPLNWHQSKVVNPVRPGCLWCTDARTMQCPVWVGHEVELLLHGQIYIGHCFNWVSKFYLSFIYFWRTALTAVWKNTGHKLQRRLHQVKHKIFSNYRFNLQGNFNMQPFNTHYWNKPEWIIDEKHAKLENSA